MMPVSVSITLRHQGIAFSALALVFSALIVLLPAWSPGVDIALMGILIFVLGVPHGAFDVIFAKRLYTLVSWRRWTVFCAAYSLMAAAVVGIWWLLPAAFLVAFLVVSAFHFSGDLENGTPALVRLFYGASVLVFPAWFHEGEVARLFGYLASGPFAAQLAVLLHALSLPWSVALGLTLLLQPRQRWATSLEVVSVALLATAAPPLVGFTVFFCLMHSARHTIRTHRYAAVLSWRDLLKKASAPMVACLVAGAALWPRLSGLDFDAAVIQMLFVGLAALTVPHMVLIERIRLGGWQSDDQPSR